MRNKKYCRRCFCRFLLKILLSKCLNPNDQNLLWLSGRMSISGSSGIVRYHIVYNVFKSGTVCSMRTYHHSFFCQLCLRDRDSPDNNITTHIDTVHRKLRLRLRRGAQVPVWVLHDAFDSVRFGSVRFGFGLFSTSFSEKEAHPMQNTQYTSNSRAATFLSSLIHQTSKMLSCSSSVFRRFLCNNFSLFMF